MTMQMTTMRLWAALALFAGPAAAIGCGDDDDDATGDGDADADADGDGDADGDSDADADGDGDSDGDADGDADADADTDARAFVLTSDYVTSVYGWIALDDLSTFHELGSLEGDSVATKSGDRIVLLERTLGAVTFLDSDLAIDCNMSVADEDGPSPNPHDAAIVSDTKAYVLRFGQGTIAIVNPSTCELTGTIDLSKRDVDGVPDMDAIVIAGDRAYVTLELLDDQFMPRGNGEILVIDTATDSVTGTIALPVTNPYGRFRVHGGNGDLLVPCSGGFGAADGGIIELAPGDDEATLLIGEEALAGDVGSFVVADDTHGFAIVAREFVTYLVPFDPSTGTVGDPIISSEGWDLRDVELVGDSVLVADGAPTAPGLRIFDLDGNELTDEPIDLGLPPSIVLPL